MSVDFYSCENCEEIFSDCGDYVHCDKCGMHWCCTECAEEDGFKIEIDNEKSYETSCGYCRGEKFSDDELLDHALKLLDLDREEVTEKIINERKKRYE